MRSLLGLSIFVAACGGPILQNAPSPNPTHVAAGAATAAAALTLADPDGATRKPETNDADDAPRDKQSVDRVPSDVLDRLDEAEARRRSADAPPTR